MSAAGLYALLPYIILTAALVVIMMTIAFKRNHGLTLFLTLVSLVVAFVSLFFVSNGSGSQVTALLRLDSFAYFYLGLVLAASFVVAILAYGYLKNHAGDHDEFYLLLLAATLGSAVLVASTHFASFFLGLEILSISLYAMIAYQYSKAINVEAGTKYLILAGVSTAFLLFGMALIYAELGTMEFAQVISALGSAQGANSVYILVGIGLLVVGIGFKLAVVPFHMWTPDVYEGAPAPVTGFVATISKGSMFALLLRFFSYVDFHTQGALFTVFVIISIASMFIGNLLALLQNNIKRILAYSSISHLGYMLVAFLAGGQMAITAATFYLVAYFITTLAAFGVVTILSDGDRDADNMDDYRGLAYQRPWLAALFTAVLLSLAGIPLTAGFVGKFLLVTAGVGSALWLLVIVLVVTSAIGLFYYLRIVITMYTRPTQAVEIHLPSSISLLGGLALAVLGVLLIWLGVYPGPLIQIIQAMAASLY